ncbi:tetratricopeptide repeat protein [Pedobacter frigiditerrae]|uniref:histidine kinase n=1 Tax=Pedobacter frigiditerrae TaxID=2530452 RepID=A0A4R0MSQ5_9SPHI|nr:tetratricopeptide repeat-containing sensor histidine kinase [Pedobacter frigiditerrae]TCC89252.1 tetratricopeptide repeat protein [Pedobacter frigiditerrae]
MLFQDFLKVFFVFLFTIQNSYAQNNSSFEHLLISANNYINTGNYNQATTLLNTELVKAKQAKNKKIEASVYDLLAEISIKKREFKEFKVYDDLASPIANQLKDTTLLISLNNRRGIYYMEEGKNDLANHQYNSALTMSLAKKESKKAAEVYSNLGSLFLAIGDKDKAINNFFNALKLHELNDNKRGIGETYSNISSVYYLMGKIDDAINYQKTGISIREKINDKPGLVIASMNIGQLYLLKKENVLAKQYLKAAVAHAEQTDNKKLMASAYAGMSTYEIISTKNYQAALQWQTKSIELSEKIDDKQILSRLYVSAGNLANNINDSTTSISYYNKALALSKSLKNKENISNAYEKLSNFYISKKNFQKAYENYKQHILYRDSIIERSNLSRIEEVRVKYETEKKDTEITKLVTSERLKQLQIEKQNALIAGNILLARQKQSEIELLSKEKQLQDLRLDEQNEKIKTQNLNAINKEQQLRLAKTEQQAKERELTNEKTTRNLLLGGFILLTLLLFTFFNRYQLKKKLEQQTALLNIRNNISKDLHDEIGSTLTSINILSKVSQQAIDVNADEAKKILGKIASQSKTIQQSMSDIVWSIQPNNEKLKNLFIRMREFATQTLEPLNINLLFDADEELETKSLPIEYRKEILLIYKEALTNICKHADADEVTIRFTKTSKNTAQLNITDNGTWKGETSGTGLRSMKERALAINGMLTITHELSGTLLQLLIKLP